MIMAGTDVLQVLLMLC